MPRPTASPTPHTAVAPAERLDGWPDEVIGNGLPVPTTRGMTPYAYLDNAASTPALRAVVQKVDAFLPWYSSVHRGDGFKSRVSTLAYETARERVREFVGAGDRDTVVFIKNTTEGLNRVAHMARGATVLCSIMEHHANLLPWRFSGGSIRHFQASRTGEIDEDDLARLLRQCAGPKFVALSGAYNVTGHTPPIHRIAQLAHHHGARIVVDAAQLVPHRQMTVQGERAGEELDFVVFSSHKLYAPYGAGALIARAGLLDDVVPATVGGGIVDLVTLDEVVWKGLPDREEAGSPNVVGAVALAAAMTRLEELDRSVLDRQERALTRYLMTQLHSVPGLRILGPASPDDRVGLISFVIDVPHDLVAAALAYEFGIGVRSGCFCAQPGVLHLLDLPAQTVEHAKARMRSHDHSGVPGAVRISLGLQNTRAEIDRLVDALIDIAANERRGGYERSPGGGWRPRGADAQDEMARTLVTSWI